MFEQWTTAIDALVQSNLGNPALAVPVYVLAGLVASLFPCVYPLIPITAGFLQNRARPGEARWKHPLLYWFGTMLSYGLLGVLAAAGGGAFNALMQSGLVITGIGVLFLFLAFVTIDWFPLTFETGDRLVHSAATHSGAGFTVLMGGVAGFVASACVAPALVAMLVFLARNSALAIAALDTDQSGLFDHLGIYVRQLGYGGLLSLAFGAGIGTPFFAAGVLGAKLPKSGRWMLFVKYTFGALIVTGAVYQLYKGLTVLGFSDMNIALVLGGAAAIIGAAVLGLRPPPAEDRRALVKFIFALLLLVAGAGILIRGLVTVPSASDMTTDGAAGASDNTHEMVGDLVFYRSVPYALAQARSSGRAVFIDFYADWCTNCKDFSRLTGTDARLNAALKRAVLIKVYDTDPIFEKFASDPRYPELQIGLPFFLVLNSDGSDRWKTNNYRDVAGMEKAIAAAGAPLARAP